ncbi:MAG: hypothetical protein JWQ89_746 [Devosia sp.]|uniref:hypothetical protein n=1 Tax=Devosia sp. TaxID=1871048 RepID=UPI002633ACF9|nr:hypothetical protein [Devosia sp.]MDB5539019.1 hypothetical protein [Devosia sp.]
MNTANLQLEGLYLVIAAMHETMIRKGMVTREEVDDAMRAAEQTAMNDNRSIENLRPAERDALAFPARLLRMANATVADDGALSFSALARRVGSVKMPYDDLR